MCRGVGKLDDATEVITKIFSDALKRTKSHTFSTHIGNNCSLASESCFGFMDTEIDRLSHEGHFR
jgi:hypothetical protein